MNKLFEFRLVMQITILAMTIILGSMLAWKRCKECKQITIEAQERRQYNTITSNPAILNPIQYAFLAIILGITVYIWTAITDDVLKTYPWLIGFRDSPRIFVIMVVLPIIFYAKNERARKHIKMVFWQMAPDFLQHFNPNNLIKSKF